MNSYNLTLPRTQQQSWRKESILAYSIESQSVKEFIDKGLLERPAVSLRMETHRASHCYRQVSLLPYFDWLHGVCDAADTGLDVKHTTNMQSGEERRWQFTDAAAFTLKNGAWNIQWQLLLTWVMFACFCVHFKYSKNHLGLKGSEHLWMCTHSCKQYACTINILLSIAPWTS